MKFTRIAIVLILSQFACAHRSSAPALVTPAFEKGYAPVNGLSMYYEIHGQGTPLVLLHGGGSTIGTSFGKAIPIFAKTRRVIAFEEQGHGRTADIDRAVTFENTADDVAAALKYLKIEKADFFGFSNGGSVALQVAVRHPGVVGKIISSSTIYRRDGMPAQFWEGMKKATLKDMPQDLKEAYLKIAPNPKNLQTMHDKDALRMNTFKDWPDRILRGIQAPTLVMIGDQDVVRPEHAVQMAKLLPHGRLMILPGGHDNFLGDSTTLKAGSRLPELVAAAIEEFLADRR